MPSKAIYFAGPLFTQAERDWNAAVATELRAGGYNVLLPQDQAAAIVKSTGGLTAQERTALFAVSIDSIRQADAVVAILDGPDADSGTCFECGYAFALNRPIVGVRTDLRFGGDDKDRGVNLMLSESCKTVKWMGIELLAKDHRHTATAILAALKSIGL